MAFTKLTADLGHVSDLPNRPNDGGYTAAQLKAVFDEAAGEIQTFLNGTLIEELEGTDAAGNIGIDAIEGMEAATVQAALAELKEAVDDATVGTLPDGSVTTGKLAAKAVTTAKLADGAVTGTQLGSGAVSAAKLGSNAVETAKIKDSAVTTAKIAGAAVTAAKLASSSVETAKLNDGAVTTAKLADGAVTAAKTSGIQPAHVATSCTVPAITANGTQTVSVPGVTASNTVIVTAAPGDFLTWRNAGVYCSAQGAGTLTFYSESGTSGSTTANIVILN